jgi:two-component sensor histidine kinase
MTAPDAALPPLSPRIAIVSIVAFWSLYFAILSFRALAIYNDHIGLDIRALVSLASAGITFLFYLILRRVPIARLGLCITIAAFLAAPSAFLYSTVNYYAFLDSKMSKEDYPAHSAPAAPTAPVAVPGMMAPPMPPAAAMTVGTMEKKKISVVGEIADQAANGYFFFCSWAALYLALCYAARLGAVERRAAQLQAAAQSAELRALRYQVNPHFLFNTLNSLSSLVMTDRRDQAEQMILNLATFFRTSLTGDPTEDVQLAEEIQLQRLYLDIEAVRFPERLAVAIDLPATLERACVPGLILQPLVENAVKYGVSRSRRPVTIRIRAQEQQGKLQLIVEDDGEPVGEDGVHGTGVGLRNVRDRLAARYGAEGRSLWGRRPEGGFMVTLEMPLVRDGC